MNMLMTGCWWRVGEKEHMIKGHNAFIVWCRVENDIALIEERRELARFGSWMDQESVGRQESLVCRKRDEKMRR